MSRLAPLGITVDGLHIFTLPRFPTQLEWLLHQWFSVPALLCWLCLASSLLCLWFYSGVPYVVLCLAIFWRLMCNLGLGCLLHMQSAHRSITNWVDSVRQRPDSYLNHILTVVLRPTMPDKEDVVNDKALPSALPAWILFRCVVNLVELNEVFAFTLMAVQYGVLDRYRDRPIFTTLGYYGLPVQLLCGFADVLGLLLIGLSIYSKVAARRTAGDYGWYWGDFFFLCTGGSQLSFDGVFELFPHPMYTIGYGWTYGCAILARSFTVLACVMVFHCSQLLFLAIVEAPHVERLYGSDKEDQEQSQSSFFSLLPTSLPKFDAFNGYDVNLLLMVIFFVLGIQVNSYNGGLLDNDFFFLANAVFWRALSFSYQAIVLVQQEKTKFWTNSFLARSKSKYEAFASWKRSMVSFSTLQYTSYVLAFVRVSWVPPIWSDIFFSPQYISQIMLSLLLMMLSAWSLMSCYEALGEYGWFYGDFFLPPQAIVSGAIVRQELEKSDSSNDLNALVDNGADNLRPTKLQLASQNKTGKRSSEVLGPSATQPTYQGIYRYLNDPEIYLGHLWMYGLALMGSSWDCFVVASLSHAIKIAFLQAVEKPHVRSVYKQHVRKYGSALERVAKAKVNDIKENETAIFLANWIKHPRETGALAPSSQQLARAMCDTMYLEEGCVVLELGPGTGPFTREILARLQDKPNSHYIGFELSPEFVIKLKTLFPSHADCFVQESAEEILPILRKRQLTHADTIISGLPWAIFPDALQRSILKAVYESLRPGGRFCTFAYLQGLVLPAGQNFRGLLETIFDTVERSPVVWKNFPPAFVYRCQKD